MLGFNLKRFFTVRTVVNLSNPISSLDSRVSRFLFKRTEAFERSCYSRSINYDYAFERGRWGRGSYDLLEHGVALSRSSIKLP